MADFLCIFGRNLKLMATGLGWWENSEFFLVTPEVPSTALVNIGERYLKLQIFQDTLIFYLFILFDNPANFPFFRNANDPASKIFFFLHMFFPTWP